MLVLRSSFRFRSVMRSGVEASAIEMTTFVEGGGDDDRESSTVSGDASANAPNPSGSSDHNNGGMKTNGKGAAKNGFHFR